jgi:L,D-transpeptidase YcbB
MRSHGIILLIVFFCCREAANAYPVRVIAIQDTLTYHANYYHLEKVLDNYEQIRIKGGWNRISYPDHSIQKGMRDSSVILLRERLSAENYKIKKMYRGDDLLDAEVRSALKLFQKNNGISITGNLDTTTIDILNISVEKRIEQIKANMERWKDFPKQPGNYLLVNTADFRLEAIENDSVVIHMKVIIGKPERKTPMLHATITHIIFNPTWSVPPTILREDLLPIILEDTSYLRKKHIRIFRNDQGIKKEIPADSVQWDSVSVTYFPYQLIQDPGPENAMGAIKFMFHNKYNVYLHDTPYKNLFSSPQPTYSSGCIRVSEAAELAAYLLKNNSGWDNDKILKTIFQGKTTTVYLKNPADLFIEYFTVWIGTNGQIQFRNDFYERDYL